MTKQINLIELLSLFSPCNNFPKDFNVEILDRHGPNFTKKFCELVQEYLELQEDLATDLTNSLYTSIVDNVYVNYESGDLQISIDSHIHEVSDATKLLTFGNLKAVLDLHLNTFINVWNPYCNSIGKLEFACVYEDPVDFYEGSSSWDEFDEDMLIMSLTLTREPYETYSLVIHLIPWWPNARLEALAHAKSEEGSNGSPFIIS